MKRTTLLITVLIALGVWIIWTFRPPADQSVLRLNDRKAVEFGKMLADLKKVDMVFIGEIHDNASHHESELKIISAMHESGVPIAIGLEMFRAEDQAQLDLWTSGLLDLHAFIRLYYDNWQAPWPLYRDILLYSREHQIPLLGLNIPEALSGKIFREGFDALTPSERQQLPPGISCSVDPRYMDLIRRVYGAHLSSGKSFVYFCEAQMVWDKSMAWRLVEFKKKNPALKVVVLTGTAHAWKHGIPEQVREASGYSFRVVLPGLPTVKGPVAIDPSEADYLLR